MLRMLPLLSTYGRRWVCLCVAWVALDRGLDGHLGNRRNLRQLEPRRARPHRHRPKLPDRTRLQIAHGIDRRSYLFPFSVQNRKVDIGVADWLRAVVPHPSGDHDEPGADLAGRLIQEYQPLVAIRLRALPRALDRHPA